MPNSLHQLITQSNLISQNQRALLLKFGPQLEPEVLTQLEEQFSSDPAMVTFTAETLERKYGALTRGDLKEFNDMFEAELEMIEQAS